MAGVIGGFADIGISTGTAFGAGLLFASITPGIALLPAALICAAGTLISRILYVAACYFLNLDDSDWKTRSLVFSVCLLVGASLAMGIATLSGALTSFVGGAVLAGIIALASIVGILVMKLFTHDYVNPNERNVLLQESLPV